MGVESELSGGNRAAVQDDSVLPWITSAVDAERGLTLTVKSLRSGSHLTYRLRPVKRDPRDRAVGRVVMVDVLTGPNNGADYTFLGAVYFGPRRELPVLTGPRTQSPAGSGGSPISDDAPSAKTLHWLFGRLARGEGPGPAAEVWHDGTCARCGRPLTTPESLALGLGPICAEKLAGDA